MNAHTEFQVPANLRKVSESVEEYEKKLAAIPDQIEAFKRAVTDLEVAATVGGTYANSLWGRYGSMSPPSQRTMETNLLVSAWKNVYNGLGIKKIAPAKDRKQYELALENPPEFTKDNVAATFEKYLLDPRQHILRGLAEVFCDLDPAYKSHSKVKIGVQGLPKRIILSQVIGYGSYGYDKLKDVLNALLAYRGRSHIDHHELELFLSYKPERVDEAKDWQPKTRYSCGNLVRAEGRIWRACNTVYAADVFKADKGTFRNWIPYENPVPGVTIKTFQNGNGHLIFDKPTLSEINLALAEFYGEVLPDAELDDDERNDLRPRSTEVSKDLAYYPTPLIVGAEILRDVNLSARYDDENPTPVEILEPSCGDGLLMQAITDYAEGKFDRHDRKRPIRLTGVEYHAERAEQARVKGFRVLTANFLETAPNPRLDYVIMNPPFAGQHWKKHLLHAAKFLKPCVRNERGHASGGGTLICILPATAFYDGHLAEMGLVPEDAHLKDTGWRDSGWRDLPVASFAESGTNVPTGYLTRHVGWFEKL